MITKSILAVSSVVLVLLLYRLAWKHEEKATTSGQLMGLTGRKWTKKFGISFFLLEYKDLIQLKKNLFEKDLETIKSYHHVLNGDLKAGINLKPLYVVLTTIFALFTHLIIITVEAEITATGMIDFEALSDIMRIIWGIVLLVMFYLFYQWKEKNDLNKLILVLEEVIKEKEQLDNRPHVYPTQKKRIRDAFPALNSKL